MRVLPFVLLALITACSSVREPLKKQGLYEKMERACLVILVNNHESGSAAFI